MLVLDFYFVKEILLYLSTLIGIVFFFIFPIFMGKRVLIFFKVDNLAHEYPITYFIGAQVMAILLVVAQLLGVFKESFVFLASVLFFFTFKEIYKNYHSIKDKVLSGAVHYLPGLVMVSIIFFFLKIFFQWPHLDLFQDIHFMKSAREIANDFFLNPGTANSYSPIEQLLMGAVNLFFNVDWIFGRLFLALGMIFIIIRCWEQINDELSKEIKTYGTTLVASLVTIYNPSNNDFSIFLSILTIPFLNNWFSSQSKYSSSKAILIRATLVLSLIISFTILGKVMLSSWLHMSMAFSVGLITLFLASKKIELNRSLVLIMICLFFSITSHRIGMLVSFGSVLFSLAWSLKISNKYKKALVFVCFGLYFLLVSGALIVFFKTFLTGERTELPFLYDFINFFTVPLFNKYIDPQRAIDTGGGIINSFIEWMRFYPPFAHLIMAYLLYFDLKEKNWGRMFKLLIPLTLLAFFCLSGIPYAYRISPLISFIFVTYICLGYPNIAKLEKNKYFPLLIGCYLFFEMHILVNYLPESRTLYLSKAFHPIKNVILFLLGLRLLFFKKNIRFVVPFGIGIEKVIISILFFSYSYGDVWQGKIGLSHYDSYDLAMSEKVLDWHKRMGTFDYIFSDPVTGSIIKAKTGLNGFFSHANLSDVSTGENNQYKIKPVKELLEMALSCNSEGLDERLLEYMSSPPVGAGEMIYHYQHFSPGTPNYKPLYERIMVILSPKTLQWLECSKSNCEYSDFSFPKEELYRKIKESKKSCHRVFEHSGKTFLVTWIMSRETKDGESTFYFSNYRMKYLGN